MVDCAMRGLSGSRLPLGGASYACYLPVACGSASSGGAMTAVGLQLIESA